MKLILGLIIPAILVLTPIIFQIVFTVRKIQGKTNLSIRMTFLWTLVLIIATSLSATMIFLAVMKYNNNSEQPIEINGIQTFIFFGILTALFITPFIGIIGGFLQYLKNKRNIMHDKNS